jgi:hypothetical protein
MSEVEILLICEGNDTSLDVRIVGPVLEKHQIRARVIAADNALVPETTAAILGYPRKLLFELKDLDFAAAADSIAPRKPHKLRWRRHEIENFIVHPWVLATTLRQLRREDTRFPWLAQAPDDEEGARRVLEEIGESLLEHHLGGTMWFERYRRSTQENPATFRRPSGEEVQTLGWPGALAREAKRVLEGCQALAQDALLDPAAIPDIWKERLQELTASDFIRSGRFLEAMEGRRLFRALHKKFISWGAAKLKPADLETILLQALLSSLGTPDEPADFRDLADHIKSQLA